MAWAVPEMSVATQGGRPHSKPPFLTASPLGFPPVGTQGVEVGEDVVVVEEEVVDVDDVVVVEEEVVVVEEEVVVVEEEVVDVLEVVVVLEVVERVELIVGLQEQAELYREGAVPQAAVALLGNPVVAVRREAVNVAQKAASDE